MTHTHRHTQNYTIHSTNYNILYTLTFASVWLSIVQPAAAALSDTCSPYCACPPRVYTCISI